MLGAHISPLQLNISIGLAAGPYYLSTYFSYFQLHILENLQPSETRTNLLLGSGICQNTAQCLPGYVCINGKCTNKCHPSCYQCNDDTIIPFKINNDVNQCKTCSRISSSWNSITSNNGVCGLSNYINL